VITMTNADTTTNPTSAADPTTVVDTYIAMWNEADPARRAQLIERAWVTEARYQDPLLEADGYVGLSEMVAGVHAQFPGQRFERLSGVDIHHDKLRFAWQLGVPGGDVTVVGIDVAEVAADGRLERITGFFGDLPAA
jgi:hypothetical protein